MNRITDNNLKTNEMVPATKITIDDAPSCYYARVYIDNEYQRHCMWADTETGLIGRVVEIIRRVYDPFGDYVFKEEIFKLARNGKPATELVSGHVKIFVPRIVMAHQDETSKKEEL